MFCLGIILSNVLGLVILNVLHLLNFDQLNQFIEVVCRFLGCNNLLSRGCVESI